MSMLSRIIQAAQGVRLDPTKRRLVNRTLEVQGMDGNGRFRKVGDALATIGHIFLDYGIEWDTTLSAHLFMADSGTRTLNIALRNEADPFSPMPITNSVLSFSWTTLQPDRIEVVAYLS